VLFQYPQTATLTLKNDSEGKSSITIPGRISVVTGQTLRLTLSNIPEFEGVDLSALIELASVSEQTRSFLELSSIPLAITTEDINQAIGGNLVTRVVYLPDAENAEIAIAGIETLVTTRLDPGIDPLEDAQKRGQILAIHRLGNRSPSASTGKFHRVDFLLDREIKSFIGRDPGEPIYNDKLKRFKFRLEKIDVSTVETAEAFFHHYRKGGEDNPKIIGA